MKKLISATSPTCEGAGIADERAKIAKLGSNGLQANRRLDAGNPTVHPDVQHFIDGETRVTCDRLNGIMCRVFGPIEGVAQWTHQEKPCFRIVKPFQENQD